ncbi:N-acetylneuraminate lyase-like isoform X1 [Phalacrocorax aristotelis]|uniref:N-acetylneuraminate lyase-like isoform X1 n=1 Tax=Phalacrocorax aristotelis TaxID=126867 RepID=UPI003F4C8354
MLSADWQDEMQRCNSMTPGKKLQGLVAAAITPMTPDGQINLSVIHQYVDYLVSEQKVKNVFGKIFGFPRNMGCHFAPREDVERNRVTAAQLGHGAECSTDGALGTAPSC